MKAPADHIFAHTPATLAQWCVDRGMATFRATQILEWVYRRGIVDPGQMTNLSKRDRDVLAAEMTFVSGRTVRHQVATDGTQKLLVEWDGDGDRGTEGQRDRGGDSDAAGSVSLSLLRDGDAGDPSRQTECVMIPALDERADGQPAWRTACISSQVGCPVGCRFCASGLGGLDGNLSSGRIVEQVWLLDQALKQGVAGGGTGDDAGRASAGITNVVFMGMGEPLANFSQVVAAVRTLAADWGMGLSARRITISTVGMHRAIERLADELEVPVTLALSLHAPNDELRRELIPWAEFTTIEQLLSACRKWFNKTGREITLEYIMLGGVNDRPEHAAQLAGLARSLRANVNLIRYNEVGGLPYARPGTGDVRRFQEVLRGRGINCHIRASRGRDIAAACGQLRHEASIA